MTATNASKPNGNSSLSIRRVRVPSMLQIEAAECGAASMAMVLAHHGRWLTMEAAREACGVSRDGSKASNILKAARRFGFEAKGFRKEIADLAAMAMPVIIHWNFDHFLVLEGIEKGRAFLNDPAWGPRIVTVDELDDAFTGVVMTIVPGPAFEPGGERPKLWRIALSRLEGLRSEVRFILLSAAALVLPGIALSAFARVFVDDVLVDGQTSWLRPLLIGMLLTAMLRGALTYVQQHMLVRLETRIGIVGASRFMWHILRLPISFFGARHPGDIAQRIAANERIARLLSRELAQTAANVFTSVFLGIVLLLYDPILGATTVFLLMPNIWLVRYAARVQEQHSQRQLSEQIKLSAASIGALQAMETLKASALEDQAFGRWAGFQTNLLGVKSELGQIEVLLTVGPILLSTLTGVAVIGIGALRVLDGSMTVGALVAFQTLAASFSAPIAELIGLSTQVQAIKADLLRVEDAYSNGADPAIDVPLTDRLLARSRGALDIEGLAFGYNPLEPAMIADFNLRLEPGSRVALVGGSGSGKSTVARLIGGLLKPWNGQILLDGRPIGDIPAIERAGIMGVVDQEIFLFEGSIRDNLTLWDPTIAEAALTAALEDAAIFADVARRPLGIDARVEEGGTNFSGGQRQRLEIARALAGNPALLILDEATAALDATTEKMIDDNLRRRGTTCLIVAHRLSTVRDCDEIIVMRRGRIVERGDHDSLMGMAGEYARLISAG